MKLAFLAASLIAGVVIAGSASAATITYSETATATGSLGSHSFSNALVTITTTGNTSAVSGSSRFMTNTVTGTVSIAGLDTTALTDILYAFYNQGSAAAGIADSTQGGSILDTYSSAFGAYNLASAVGPVTGSRYIRPDLFFHTQAGLFNLSSSGNSTFTAAIIATPEPLSLALFGFGTAGVALIARRRKGAEA